MTATPVARKCLWFGLLVTLVAALRAAATGVLAPPPVSSLDQLGTWADQREPVEAALAVVRQLAELTAWYLLALSLLHLLAGPARLHRVLVLADVVALPGVTRLVRGALGLGLVTAATVAGDPRIRPPVPAQSSLIRSTSDDRSSGGTGTATMRPLADAPGGTAQMTPVQPVAPEITPAPAPSTWRVDRGESFWSIAAELLEQSWQRPASDREIDPFWRVLIDVNRGRLADEHDPNLVYPGQVFEVPPVPRAPSAVLAD